MNSSIVRRVSLPIALTAALAGLTACNSADASGSSGKDKAVHKGVSRVDPIAALRSVERSTDGADSAKVESTTSLGSLMDMKADGVMGWSHGLTGTMTITYTGGTYADTMRRIGSSSIQARYLSDAYYARMGDTFARQSGGKHWIRYGYDDLARFGGSSGAYLKDQMQNTTPNQSVKLLLASGDVRKVGSETVRGRSATHYAGTVDVTDLAARSSHLSAGQLADLRKQLTAAGVSTEKVDIWVDGKDLLVKKVEKAELTSGTMTSTAYYSDYGTKAAAQEPPAGDTADFKDLLKTPGAAGGAAS